MNHDQNHCCCPRCSLVLGTGAHRTSGRPKCRSCQSAKTWQGLSFQHKPAVFGPSRTVAQKRVRQPEGDSETPKPAAATANSNSNRHHCDDDDDNADAHANDSHRSSKKTTTANTKKNNKKKKTNC